MAVDYTTLTSAKTVAGSIKNWVNRSDLPVDDIIDEAEAWLWEEGGLRVREMIATDVVTFSTTSNQTTLPSTDFLDPISYQPYEWAVPLRYVLPQGLNVTLDSSGDPYHGDPTKWALVDNVPTINTIPVTSGGLVGVMTYYARPTALSAGNATNFITVRYPTMFRHILLAKAYSHMKDYNRSLEEEKMAYGKLELIKKNADLYLRGADLDSD